VTAGPAATAGRYAFPEVDDGLWFLVIGIGLVIGAAFVLMRRGVFGQPGRTPMDDVQRVLKWAAIGFAVWAIPMLAFMSIVVYADYSVSRPADAPLAGLPLLLAVGLVALVAVLVRQRRPR
jgi:peptidoglycan/LPS O-acetylase OafA/YrhL